MFKSQECLMLSYYIMIIKLLRCQVSG